MAQDKSLLMTVLMTPDMANFAGNVHGGALLKLLDQTAYACAARYCKSYCVTVSLDHVFFKEPVKIGELVTLHANVNYVGSSSLEVGVKVIAENLRQNTKRHTNSSYFTFVCLDEQGRPCPAPPLEIESDREQRLFEAAKMRRALRKEMQERNRQIQEGTTFALPE